MKYCRLALTISLALLLCACFPEERIWWQHDGQRALVAIDNTFHLVDADGSPPVKLQALGQETISQLSHASWLPDNKGFVCSRKRQISSWEELQAAIDKSEIDLVEATVPLLPPLLDVITKTGPAVTNVETLVAQFPSRSRKRYRAALRRALQHNPDAIRLSLLRFPHGKQIIEELSASENGYQVIEVCLVLLDGNQVKESRTLLASMLRVPLLPKVSPAHSAVALFRLEENEQQAALEVWQLEGGSPLTISHNASGAFDWMPDGRALTFSTWIRSPGSELQNIQKTTILRPDGSLIAPGMHPASPTTEPKLLATAAMLQRPVLQSLPDGRILFAAQPLVLPMAGGQSPVESGLYLIAADGSTVNPVPTADGALPADLGHLVLSPDGHMVAVVESNTDAVAVIHLDDGRMQVVSPPHQNWKCRTIPSWKSPTELTFAGLSEGSDNPAWMLWNTDGSMRVLSKNWQAALTSKWLEKATPDKPIRTGDNPAFMQ